MRKTSFLIIIFLLSITVILKAQSTSQIYSSAMDAYNSADYTRAANLFNEFFKQYSITDELYATAKYYSSDALLHLGESSAASNGFEYLVNNFKWSAFRDKALYKLGQIFYDDGSYSRCRYYLVILLGEYPSSDYDGSALYLIGESYSKENRLDEAVSFLKQAIESPKNNSFVDYSIYTLARVYEKQGDYKNAVKYYDQLLSFHRNSKLVPDAQIRIGMAYFKLKDYQSSILELNNPLVNSLPKNQYAQSLFLLGNSYYRVKDYAKAEKTYKTVINDFPMNELLPEVKYDLAWCYFQQKRYNEAYGMFNSLSAGSDSIAVKSFFWKGESKRYAGQEAEAFNIYKEFLLKYPNNNLAYGVQYLIGVVYFNGERYDLAEKFLQAAFDAPDESIKAKAYTLMGEIKIQQNKYDEAIKNFQSVLALQSTTEDLQKRALLGLGTADFYSKNYNDAVSNLIKLSTEDKNFESNKANFFLAESYFNLEQYDTSLKRYNLVSNSDPKVYGLAIYGKAYCYYNLGDYENAVLNFSEFIKKYPNDSKAVDARLRLADSYYGTKNFASASKVYKELFNFGKSSLSNPGAYYQYAQTLYKSGNTTEAINEFRNLQRKFPRSEYADKSLYIVGWIYFQQNNYDEAIMNYRNVLQQYPSSSLGPTIYYSIGDAYFNLAEYDSAIASYQKVMTDYPTSSHVFDAINGIQYSYIAKNQPEKAVGLIDEFVNRNPGLSFADQIYIKKGEIYYGLQEYDKAETSYKDFITKFPSSKSIPDAYYWIGKSAENLHQDQEAVFNFSSVFNNYPKSESAAAAVIELGNIYNSMKNYDEALNILNRGMDQLSQSSRLPEIMFLKAVTLSSKGDVTKAYEAFNNVVTEFGSSIFSQKAKFELGLIDLAAKRYDNATQYFQGLATNRTDDIGAKAQYYLGETLFEQDKITDAISAFVRVRTIFSAYDEWLTRSFLRLGDCYLKLKDNRQAKEMYRTVISKHRNDEFGKEAGAKLRKVK
jgi:TolA-binding protein